MAATILVADDDDGYRYPIVNLFQDFGFEVLEATNEQDVLKHAPHADCWIIDVRLPTEKMEGIAAVLKLAMENQSTSPSDTPLMNGQSVKAIGSPRTKPVIFISVLPKELAKSKLDELTNARVNHEWVEKPFELEFLLEKVKRALKL